MRTYLCLINVLLLVMIEYSFRPVVRLYLNYMYIFGRTSGNGLETSSLSVATNVCGYKRQVLRVAMLTQSLTFLLNKTRTKIQNLKPIKPPVVLKTLCS